MNSPADSSAGRVQRANFGDRLVELRGGASAEREFRPLPSVVECDRLADAAARAGDQRDFVFEFHDGLLEYFKKAARVNFYMDRSPKPTAPGLSRAPRGDRS